MSSIYTLEADIKELLKTKNWMTDSLAKELGDAVSSRIKSQFENKQPPSLRLSQMGPRCPKALWHSIHTPELAEPMQHWAEAKFSIGHFWEAYGLILAKAAGHRVEGEQHELTLNGIKGHCDAIIDGALVDFKSCSSRQFSKYKSRLLEQDDPFGYLDQLDGYVLAGRENPLILMKDRGFIVAIDKQMGHMYVYEHFTRERSIIERIEEYKSVVARSNPPECTCETTPYGNSGNISLGTRASYSPYKWVCFSNLRCFLYKTGPVFFNKVVRRPDGYIREIDRYGNTIHS